MDRYNTANFVTLPVCVGESYCACFDSLYTNTNDLNSNISIFDYTQHHSKEVANYLSEISKHINKDGLLKERYFSQVPAFEVKKSNDRFRDTIHRLQSYQRINDSHNTFSFYYFNNFVTCKQISELFEKIAETQDLSLRYLNKPNTLLPVSCLLEILHLHQICLYILQQFYHMLTYKKPLYMETFPNLNIRGFQFR